MQQALHPGFMSVIYPDSCFSSWVQKMGWDVEIESVLHPLYVRYMQEQKTSLIPNALRFR